MKECPDHFLKVIDNLFDRSVIIDTHKYVCKLPYYYGETDNLNDLPTGMVCNLNQDDWLISLIGNKIQDYIGRLTLYRSYVNIFAPSENPHYHKDGDSGLTVLYYPNSVFNLDQGGETSFIINDSVTGVLPIPGRVVIFSANIVHRANSFRDVHRFSVALKYKSTNGSY